MKRELPVDLVRERLAMLRSLYVAESEQAARERFRANRSPGESFETAAARRLSELRTLCELTRHLHAARPNPAAARHSRSMDEV